jgi:hypothetical protein
VTTLPAFRRAIASLWLAVFAFAGVGVPVLDAEFDHSADVAAHWEDSGDRSCPPRHDASVCQFFHAHHSARTSQGASLSASPEVEFETRRPETLARVPAEVALLGGRTSRGPPLG